MIDALEWAKGSNGASVRGSPKFCGTSGIGPYIIMLREGWPEGVKGVEGLEGLSTDASEKLMFVRSVAGAFPIVPALLAGAPDSMLMPRMLPVDHVRGLTLVVDASFNCNVKSSDVKEYAESVMRLVAWLSAEQIETAIYAVISVRTGAKKLVYLTPIRQAGEVIMPERVAALIHPSYLRRAWFAMLEYEASIELTLASQTIGESYGRSAKATADELRQLIPEAYSVILLPKVGEGDPMKAVQESETFKLRQEGT